MLQKLLNPSINKVIEALMPLVEEQIEDLKDKALAMVAAQIPVITEKLLALLPLVTATATKVVVEKLAETIEGIDLPGLPPLGELTDQIRDVANGQIPDFDLPYLSDIFDLTDWLKGN